VRGRLNVYIWGVIYEGLDEMVLWEGSRVKLRSACKFMWSLIEMRPAIALSPLLRNILKASRIQMAALLCIFPSIFKEYKRGALL